MRLLPAFCLLLLIPSLGAAEPAPPTDNLENFQRAIEAAASQPEAILVLFVQGLAVIPRDRPLAERMISLLLRDNEVSPPTEHNPSPLAVSASEMIDQIARRPDIVRGYCGGTPQRAYNDADLDRCGVRLDREYSQRAQGLDYPEKGRAKYFVANGGSERPRPVELQWEGGRWKIRGWSSMASGVRRAGD